MPRFILVNAFDRSGSSFLSRILAKHPQIECLFHPLNSSIFRRDIFKYWDENYDSPEGKTLINNIQKGKLNKDVIKSPWFFKHSSTFEIDEDKLYIIKTTNVHFKVKWFAENFPKMDFWCHLRNPLSILASLYRNNLIKDWYGDWAFDDLRTFLIANSNFYDKEKVLVFDSLNSDEGKMAAVIAVNNSIMIKDSEDINRLFFENIMNDINTELHKITNRYQLEDFDYQQYIKEDFNVIGEGFEDNQQWEKVFSINQIDNFINIFERFGYLGYNLKHIKK